MHALAAACNRSTSFKNQRRPVCSQFSIWPCERWAGILSQQIIALECFPFVRTNRPGHYRRNDNFTFNQSSSARSVKSLLARMKKLVFEQKLLEKAYFPTGAAGKRPKIIIGRAEE